MCSRRESNSWTRIHRSDGEQLDTEQPTHPSISSLHSTLDVDILLQRFWELDEVTSHKDDEAEQDFEEHSREYPMVDMSFSCHLIPPDPSLVIR